MTFQGARTFTGQTITALLGELNRFAGETYRSFAAIDQGTERRWTLLPIATGRNAAAVFGCILPVNPSNGTIISVAAPQPSQADAGRELGILRLVLAPIVELVPSGGHVDGDTATPLALPPTPGLYVFVADTDGVWRRR